MNGQSVSTMNNREKRKLEKRNRILEAAIKVIAKNGFHGTTISQVASVAEVADGTIYLYFQNKDDILVSIFEETMEMFITQGLEVISQYDSVEDKLRAIARCHLGNLGSNEELACVFQVELRHSIHIMKKFSQTKLREYFGVIQKVVEEGQRQGVVRADLNPWTAVKVFFGALDEMGTNWILRQKDYRLIDMAEPTVDIFLNGIRKPGV
ncbi:MAG: TetR/AcrR family transcriptional regulator [Acidobacteria bacterium]|nr:TetR/AcrR family transcriptional regulator [Acidobacteriota bacterium]